MGKSPVEEEGNGKSIITSAPQNYDVFINDAGKEGKNSFGFVLYQKLLLMGLRVYFDTEEELHHWDSLPITKQDAMRSSSAHIAIFSRKYAECPRCLTELSFMLAIGAKIVPVFYGVSPADVRWARRKEGMYAQAFADFYSVSTYQPKEIEGWIRALNHVANMKNRIIFDGDAEKMLMNIVGRVKEIVSLEVGKHCVGLDEAVENFEKVTIQSSSEDVKIVGIVGMGGCGKTTLAKELYNRKRWDFDSSSFLSSVGETANESEFRKLQRKLAEDLARDIEDFRLQNVGQQKEKISHPLRSKRLLIVLDGIEHVDQVNSLLPTKESIGSGSLIIITTRDISITKCCGISSIYEMEKLDRSHAKQLFCLHAFSQPRSATEFEDLVERFLENSDLTPLPLVRLAEQLCGKSRDYWESHLLDISSDLDEHIKEELLSRFHALETEEQELLFDISFFFYGEKLSLAIPIWDASERNSQHLVQTLQNNLIVELDHENRIRMNRHLINLGKELAGQRKPCRFSLPGIVQNQQADYSASQIQKNLGLSVTDARQIPRVLVLKGEFSNRVRWNETTDLLWLRWYDCPHTTIPPAISLQKLIVLQLFNGAFNNIWLHNAEQPTQLRELNISGSIRKLPKSIGQLQYLQTIVVDGWPDTNLKGLPEELCQLKSLSHLTLRWCRALTLLPKDIGNLINLQHLDLSFCSQLKELPQSFKELVLLQHLDLQGCGNLGISPHFLGKITSLKHLNFKDCRKLRVLPANLASQVSLRSLCLEGTTLQELPNEVGRLTNLEVLEIGSPYLRILPLSIGNMRNLKKLNLEGCTNLTSLPNTLGVLRQLSVNKPRVMKETVKENTV
ncbi:hypothetical protein SUGI_0705010 [Cryptomeria japonica]|uniref:disease resistance protein RPV1-like n=1 Tax=Cryptomeria japonica TaxID=3369 RepID=UPI0024148A1C|nr:disease resistance protein RPV1-like [Cryptomeria japonica]GLJ35029.1 hypothetical protein SUGI_0705010 [Cryptomeria japonica]